MDMILWGTLGAFVLFILLLGLIFLFQLKGGTTTSTVVVTTPGPGATSATTPWTKKHLLLGGIVGIIILGVIAFMFWPEKTTHTDAWSTDTLLIWTAGIAILALFIAGIMGKGGVAGKWTLVLVGIIAAFFLLQQLFYMNSYGDRAPDVRAEFQKRNVTEALSPPKATPEHEAQDVRETTKEEGGEMIYLTLAKGTCSEIGVPRGQSIDWWFLQGNITVGGRPSPNAEITYTLTGPMSHYVFCGDGRMSYRLRPS